MIYANITYNTNRIKYCIKTGAKIQNVVERICLIHIFGCPTKEYYYEYPMRCTACGVMIIGNNCGCYSSDAGRAHRHNHMREPECCDCYCKRWGDNDGSYK